MTRDAKADTRLGTISAYDPNNHAIKVILQPDQTETGWMPLATPWSGKGWGMFAAPSIGDQIKVHFQEGNHEAPIASLRLFSDVDRPVNAPSGVFYLIHKSGSFLKFNNDGSVSINSSTNLTATVGGSLNATVTGNATLNAASWAFTGNMTVAGNLSATGNITDGVRSLAADRAIYNLHTHSGIATGSSNTNNPNQPQ